MRRSQFFVLLAIVLSVITPVEAAVEGTVVTARLGAHPLFLWDCSSVVARIVRDGRRRDDALRSLEAQAVRVAAARLASAGQARDLTVRAIYQKSGAVSPVYKTATLEGVEQVFDVTVEVTALRSGDASLSRALEQGEIPNGVKIAITGALPPE